VQNLAENPPIRCRDNRIEKISGNENAPFTHATLNEQVGR